jgi:hypothetical protein
VLAGLWVSRHSDFVADCMCVVRKCSCNQPLSSVFAVGFGLLISFVTFCKSSRASSKFGPASPRSRRISSHPPPASSLFWASRAPFLPALELKNPNHFVHFVAFCKIFSGFLSSGFTATFVPFCKGLFRSDLVWMPPRSRNRLSGLDLGAWIFSGFWLLALGCSRPISSLPPPVFFARLDVSSPASQLSTIQPALGRRGRVVSPRRPSLPSWPSVKPFPRSMPEPKER